MHTLLLAAALVSAAPTTDGGGQAAKSAPDKVLEAKVSQMLEQSSLKYRKADEGLWAIAFKGDSSTSFDVLIQIQNGIVVVFATVDRKVSLTQPQMQQILHENYKANFSKLAIDDDGDLLALTELPADVSARSLRSAIDEVASLTDTAVGVVTADAPTQPAAPPAGRPSAPVASTGDAPPSVAPAVDGTKMSLLKGTFELTYDPKKWKADATREPGTTQLVHMSGDAYVKVITERLEVETAHLKDVALKNAANVTPDVQIVGEWWRTVNGMKTLLLQYSGSTSGIKFTFFNQMYSDTSGTVQLAAWTGTNLFPEFRQDFLELFAGFKRLP
jgi:hypothetical protein